MSLLYECINTVIAVLISVSSGVPGDHTASIQLCVQKLSVLIEDSDQNLKYLGLLAMGKILQTHPKAVQSHKDLILACMDDRDESIRLRALDLLYGMVSKKNIMEIVKKLMIHVDSAEGSMYRDELLAKIIQICSHNNYQYITNFEWYVSVLVELTKVEGTKHGLYIAQQMLDVAVRVQSIRHYAVSQMALLIENSHVLLGTVQRSNISEVLFAAVWITGEYSEHLRNKQAVLESMLRTKVTLAPGHIQSVLVQNIGKLYAQILSEAEADEDWDKVESLDNLLLSKLPQFELSENIEVQERACTLIQLMKEVEQLHRNREKVAVYFAQLSEGELNPIAPKAQRKVPVPEGLDLETWINAPLPESPPNELENGFSTSNLFVPVSQQAAIQEKLQKKYEPTEEELVKIREARHAEQASNPHYLKGSIGKQRPGELKVKKLSSRDSSIPESASLDLQTPLEIPGVIGLDKYMEQQEQTLSWKKLKKGKKKKKSKSKEASSDEEGISNHQVYRDQGEMPENAKSTDEDEELPDKKDIHKALDIDLDEPLKTTERLPVLGHRMPSPKHEKLADSKPIKAQASDSNIVSNKIKKKNKKSDEASVVASSKEKTKKKSRPIKQGSELAQPEPCDTSKISDENIFSNHVKQQADDFDVFLLGNPVAEVKTSNGPASVSCIVAQNENHDTVFGQQKKKGRKKSKSDGKEKRSRKLIADIHNRSEYEETSGICTPTKESLSISETPRQVQSPSPPAIPELSKYKLLASNDKIMLMCFCELSSSSASQVTANVTFNNVSSSKLIQLEVGILNSMNARLIKNPGCFEDSAVKIPFALQPQETREHCFQLSIDVISSPQKLRGTLTYMVPGANGIIPEKLDFFLRVPVLTFTSAVLLSREAFMELHSNDSSTFKNSIKLTTSDVFPVILYKLGLYGHLSVVEQVGTTASLFCQSVNSDPFSILVKLQDTSLLIDGKSSNEQFLSYAMEEIKDFLAS